MKNANEAWAQVLHFWFPDRSSQEAVPAAHGALWFRKSDQTDAHIKATFGGKVDQALAGAFVEWENDSQGRLAKIVLLDQFTRNIYRGTPKAFAGDSQALELALGAIESGLDQAVSPNLRLFYYLPLEHSEDIELQDRCVAIMADLVKQITPAHAQAYQGYHQYAVKHRDVIARFGRFPHRNKILGRPSTLEELEFLKQPGSSF